MATKKVLIIDDEDPSRLSLEMALQASGFEVYSAGRVADARALFRKYGGELDVAVLDMELFDPVEPETTGADIGIEFRDVNGNHPEFVVYSKVDDRPDFYHLAVKLEAAAYIEKRKHKDPDVVRYVKVLALRHALRNENSVTADKMARIATQCHDRSELIKKFCQHILKPEVEACLKVPFVILLTDQNETRNCADLSEKTHEFYFQLQELISNHDNRREPFILEASKLDPTSDPETAQLHQTLDRAAFVPLSVSEDLQLSVGIVQETESELVPDPEDAKALCTLLSHYLKPTIFENMLKIWPRWAELRATRTSTARLCRVVGQELKYMLPARGQEERSWPEGSLSRLWSLADDLSDTGDLLRDLEERRWGERLELVSMREIAEMAWRWITHDEERPEKSFAMIGDCMVEGDRRDLDIAVSRLLHWLAQRRAVTPFDEEPLVTVRCGETAAGPTVVFEDKSQRLHKKLREEMFATFSHAVPVPFDLEFEITESAKSGAEEATGKSASKLGRYLPLYLAQMLIEGRYHGTLEDHSDDEDLKDRPFGHRVVMQFPFLERKETV